MIEISSSANWIGCFLILITWT